MHDYRCQLSPLGRDWMTELDRCEETEPSTPTLSNFIKHTPMSEYRYVPIWWHTKRVLGIQWRWFQFQLKSGLWGSTGLPEDGPSGHSQDTSRFRMYLKGNTVQLMCRIPMWEWTITWLSDSLHWVRQWHHFFVRQSQLGVTSMCVAERAYLYKLVAAVVDALCELEN